MHDHLSQVGQFAALENALDDIATMRVLVDRSAIDVPEELWRKSLYEFAHVA